jgi:hypothetical protein
LVKKLLIEFCKLSSCFSATTTFASSILDANGREILKPGKAKGWWIGYGSRLP